MPKCQACARHLTCDWQKPPKGCRDFVPAPPHEGPVTGSLTEAFKLVKGRRCRVRLRGGRKFTGVPVAMEPGDFMLVKGKDEILVVNEGHDAEFTFLDEEG
jgi:hypothetical protein